MTDVLGGLLAALGVALLFVERHGLTTGILIAACFLISMGMWLVDSALLTSFFAALGNLLRARHGDGEK